MKISAPAKVNLYLNITGKRDDGYHLLDSLMVFVDVHDDIIIEPADGKITLDISGEYAKYLTDDVENNLVIKVAEALKAHTGDINLGAKMGLVKNIPIGAGLGGGSSDAACVLKALNRFWSAGLSKEELADIGIRFGSDIVFCLEESAAFVSGAGEIVESVGVIPRLNILLVNPNIPLGAGDVYRKYSGKFSGSANREEFSYDSDSFVDFLAGQKNDLQEPAIVIVPEIENILSVINGQNGCLLARMSGSGTTCFGLFKDDLQAHKAVENIKAGHPNWWVRTGYIY